MAKSRRRARKQAPQAPTKTKEHKRQAAIWLATLSTVVGIATGMFTLRDQVFPRESGSAQAVSVSAFQQQVGDVCDDVNTDDSRRARQVKTIHRQLERAKTTTAQRNALLDGQRQTIARSGDALASLTALEPPKALRPTGHAVTAAWKRNLARLSEYARRLDRAATRTQLEAALEYLSGLRAPLVQDGVELMAGLRKLGGPNCDLRTPINTKTFPLPPLNTPEHVNHSTETESDVASSGVAAANGAARSGVAGASASSTGSAGTTGATTPPSGGSTGTAGTAAGGASTGTPGTTGGGAVPHPPGTGTAGGTGGSVNPVGVGGGSTGGSGGGGSGAAGGGG
jgi:hypothetical protein